MNNQRWDSFIFYFLLILYVSVIFYPLGLGITMFVCFLIFGIYFPFYIIVFVTAGLVILVTTGLIVYNWYQGNKTMHIPIFKRKTS